MSTPGRRTTGISADELTERFQSGARVLWTLAAGLLGDPAEAEDLCQEAYLAAYAKRDRFEPGTNFLAWMGRFVRNVASNERKKRARRRTASADPDELDRSMSGALASERSDAALLDDEAFDERLVAGLRELGEIPRTCLLLRTVRELTYAEISALLDVPEGTAMSHVHRARALLRAKLAPDLDPSLGARP